jgi:uncharacterized protein (TIGR03435 family)
MIRNRALCFAAVAVVLAALSASAQSAPAAAPPPSPAASIVFDTVSVKPNRSNDSHPGSMIRPDGFDAENITPIWVMYWAFGHGGDHNENFFSGLPAWVSSDRFDIIAKVAGPDVPVWGHMSDAEKQRMIRDVFADRFKLQAHVETQERPVYAMEVAKGGAKLQAAKPSGGTLIVPAMGGSSIHPDEGWFGFSRTGIVAGNLTMEKFAAYLTTLNLGREVQDRTGLTGRYDLKLDFAPLTATAPSAESAAPAPDAAPDIFTAIQEQLGLKLEPARGPLRTLVIDHIEKPSEN